MKDNQSVSDQEESSPCGPSEEKVEKPSSVWSFQLGASIKIGPEKQFSLTSLALIYKLFQDDIMATSGSKIKKKKGSKVKTSQKGDPTPIWKTLVSQVAGAILGTTTIIALPHLAPYIGRVHLNPGGAFPIILDLEQPQSPEPPGQLLPPSHAPSEEEEQGTP